jgi:preprotein translocase subunit SecY
LVLLPSLVANYLAVSRNGILHSIGTTITLWFSTTGVLYNVVYFVLVVGFTYFYTAVVFNPKKISEEIQKYGGFIPGIRPGAPTAHYLNYILTRITLAGALFLGIIAIFPSIARAFTNIQSLVLGGTGILIVVSVILETIKALEAQLVMRNYEGFTK